MAIRVLVFTPDHQTTTKTNNMKSALRLIVIGFNAIVLISIGIWGYKTEQSETTSFWKVMGWIVSTFIIFFPTSKFWIEKLESLFESED